LHCKSTTGKLSETTDRAKRSFSATAVNNGAHKEYRKICMRPSLVQIATKRAEVESVITKVLRGSRDDGGCVGPKDPTMVVCAPTASDSDVERLNLGVISVWKKCPEPKPVLMIPATAKCECGCARWPYGGFGCEGQDLNNFKIDSDMQRYNPDGGGAGK